MQLTPYRKGFSTYGTDAWCEATDTSATLVQAQTPKDEVKYTDVLQKICPQSMA